MNDVVSAIKDDHRRIEVLLIALHDRGGREQTVRELYGALTAHTDAEETEVYPLIEDGISPREAEVLAAHEAHARADILVKSLLDSSPDSEDFDAILADLEEVITRHRSEERRVGKECRAEGS